MGKVEEVTEVTKVKKVGISVIIIARNEEEKIADCIESVKDWAEEIVLVDSGSVDKTIDIAKRLGARVIKTDKSNFADWRNDGWEETHGEWIFYVDADERVTPLLKKEISEIINSQLSIRNYSAYAVPRRNFILGREMKHGGEWPDYQKRLFNKKYLSGWEGELHEQPVFEGSLGHLKNPLIHLKHDNFSEMVAKTNNWSEIEAALLYKAGHPKMQAWRFIRIMATELWQRLIVRAAFLDGPEGIIYSIYQMWSKFLTYAKLWEMQLENQKSNIKN